MKQKKLSFLIAAHNEEKIISKTLDNLINLPYKNYEVILGLDGCTDKTEEIVKSFMKKSKKIRYYKLNLRQGKPEVIDTIIKKAKGEIIIINDADWIFRVKDEKDLQELLKPFQDPKIGGIAESFPTEWDKENLKIANIGYKLIAYSTLFWFEFQKKNLTKKYKNWLILKEPTMFLTNIFRKELYKKNLTLGDDFERTRAIMDKGKDIAIFTNPKLPRMIASYSTIKIKDIFKQKVRTRLARKQLEKTEKMKLSNSTYPYKSVSYILKRGWKSGLYLGFLVSFWTFIMAYGYIIAKFKSTDTRKGWQLRAER